MMVCLLLDLPSVHQLRHHRSCIPVVKVVLDNAIAKSSYRIWGHEPCSEPRVDACRSPPHFLAAGVYRHARHERVAAIGQSKVVLTSSISRGEGKGVELVG